MKKLFLIIGVASLLSACSSSSQLTLTHSRYGNGWGLSMGEGGLTKAEEAKAEAFRTEMKEKHDFKKSLKTMQSNKRGLSMLPIENMEELNTIATLTEEETAKNVSTQSTSKNVGIVATVPETDKSLDMKSNSRSENNAINQTDNKSSSSPMSESDIALLLLVIIAIILPPLAVFLYEGALNTRFWICLLLTIIGFWVIGIIYALVVILGNK